MAGETGLGYDFPEPTGATVRSKGIEQEFRRLLECVVEISFWCRYGAVIPEVSRDFLAEAFQILERHGIPTPSTEPFKGSSIGEAGGWGDPVSPDVAARWRETARAPGDGKRGQLQ
jgi:hypothetical protein